MTRNLSTPVYTIEVDEVRLRGWFERHSDGYGGGLWFEHLPNNKLELTDYDGVWALPRNVYRALLDAGYVMDETFDPEYEP